MKQLYYDVEQLNQTSHKKIYSISSRNQAFWMIIFQVLSTAINQAINFQEHELTHSIKLLVPEFATSTTPLSLVESK